MTALLVLEDGRIFRGEAFGAVGESLGEAVFTTGMTGYQETLTDPSYHRQIVLQTAPQIGNTGWNGEDDESARIQVAGYVVRDPSRRASNWRSTGSLDDALRAQGVVGVAGIDTRAAVRHLREHGAMRAGVFSGPALDSDETLVERVRQSPPMEGADLYGAVTTAEPYVVPAVGERRFVVAALDVGIKYNTPRMLAARGVEVHVLPAGTPIEKIDELRPDGFFLANGPGDPATADGPVALTRQVLERRIPLFGICFGNQILGRALGRGTYKLRYGHRGINVPVVEHATGRVAITSQNHGFAVAGEAGEVFGTPYGSARITHTCPNDGCVEGLAGDDFPAFSVQYHPEAAAGPHDAADLFDRFVQLMVDNPVGYGGAAGIPLPDAAAGDPRADTADAGPVGAGPDVPVDTAGVDTAGVSTATVSTAGVSTAGVDPAATDTAATDTAATDTAGPDTAVTDTAVTDTAVTDTAVTDTAVTDAAVTDAAVTDAAVTDAAVTHTAAEGAAVTTPPPAPAAPARPVAGANGPGANRPGANGPGGPRPPAGPPVRRGPAASPYVPSPPSVEDAPTGALPVQDAPTGALPVVRRTGEPDPLTAPFSDVEDALGRRGGAAGDPAAPGSGDRTAGPVSDRPWPPATTGIDDRRDDRQENL